MSLHTCPLLSCAPTPHLLSCSMVAVGSTCKRAAPAFRESCSALAGRASTATNGDASFLLLPRNVGEKTSPHPQRRYRAGGALPELGGARSQPSPMLVQGTWQKCRQTPGVMSQLRSCGAGAQSLCPVGQGSGSHGVPAHQLLCSVAFVLPGPSSPPCAELGVSVMLSWALSLSGGYKNPAGGLLNMSPPQAPAPHPR